MNVFFDCEGRECNDARTFFRTEIDWVNWVRDREDSDVHVIITIQGTGSGGVEHQLDFLGREELEGADDQMFFRSLGTDVEQERLDGLTTTLAIGLARFATMIDLRNFVSFEPVAAETIDPDARVLSSQDVDDPWNLWVFTVGASGNLRGTDAQDTETINGSFSASRTTPTWKVIFSANGSRNHQETLLSDSSTFASTLVDINTNHQVIYTLAEHWSVGVLAQASKLPKVNQDLHLEAMSAVEFSVFPYEEATRRSFTARYAIGPVYRNYEEATLFGEVEETRFEESLRLQYAHRQPWGDGSASVTIAHILDDVAKHNIALRGRVSFRIARGLSFNTGANASWVTDQIYLSAGGETDEEVLLNLRTRASDLNYGMNFGFSYRFGSIYNNVVNNRFVTIPGG